MSPDLATLRAGLTEGQRAALHQHCDGLSLAGPAWGYAERYADAERRLLAAMREELREDLYREIARGILGRIEDQLRLQNRGLIALLNSEPIAAVLREGHRRALDALERGDVVDLDELEEALAGVPTRPLGRSA